MASSLHVTPTRQFCTFTVERLSLALDVRTIQEVIRSQTATRVPTAPPTIHGLVNLRGQIVTAIDLRRRLGLPPRPGGKPPLNIVVRTEDGAVSLLVDEIGDVLDVSDDAVRPVPSTIPAALRRLLLGLVRLDDRLLLLLDPEPVIDGVDAAPPPPVDAAWDAPRGRGGPAAIVYDDDLGQRSDEDWFASGEPCADAMGR